MEFDDDPALIPGWGPVIADIARQVAHATDQPPAWAYSVTDEHGRLLHHGHTRRRPSTTERDFTRARDKTCRAPGCTRPATSCDSDHHREQAKDGGPAHRGNLASLCRRHHRLRHERGHQLHQLPPGPHIWQSANGRYYLVAPSGDLLLLADDHHDDDHHDHDDTDRDSTHHDDADREGGLADATGPAGHSQLRIPATINGQGQLYPAVFTNNPEPGPPPGLVRATFGAEAYDAWD